MRLTRRNFISLSALAHPFLITNTRRADAQSAALELAELPPVQFPAGVRVPTVEEYLEELETVTGKESPYKAEVELGRALLEDIPTGRSPYNIANRFREWREKKVGETEPKRSQYSYYAREWPVRGNPIIMGFFDATGFRKPVGDTTYWCAAFVCWTIQRSRIGRNDSEKVWPYQNGAASSSFRNHFATVTDERNVRRGDLVVFQNRAESWAGHVGFVHDLDLDQEGRARAIWVLGGNQGAQNEYNGGEVNISKFNRLSNRLQLHSFRTSPVLHPE